MAAKKKWNELRELLLDSIGDWLTPTDDDLTYLRESFLEIEELWESELAQIGRPKAILLGEAPLFGPEKSYIYSTNPTVTAFLRPNNFPLEEKAINNKAYLRQLMNKYGLIVVDIFPYALPVPSVPKKGFRGVPREKYSRLLRQSYQAFSREKLERVLAMNPSCRTMVRYRGLFEGGLKELLEGSGMREGRGHGEFFCVGSTNHPIDKRLFSLGLQ